MPGADDEHDGGGGRPRRGVLVQRHEDGDRAEDHRDHGRAPEPPRARWRRRSIRRSRRGPAPRAAGRRSVVTEASSTVAAVALQQRAGRRRDEAHERHDDEVQGDVGAERGDAPGRAPQGVEAGAQLAARRTSTPWPADGSAVRRTKMANHSTTKLAAFAATAHCAPNGTSAVASSGPITRPEFQLVMPSATAAVSSSRGTRSGRIACSDGAPSAPGAALEQHEQGEHRRVAQPTGDGDGDHRGHHGLRAERGEEHPPALEAVGQEAADRRAQALRGERRRGDQSRSTARCRWWRRRASRSRRAAPRCRCRTRRRRPRRDGRRGGAAVASRGAARGAR